jgi:8-amino-3,8-dideoxy-alpha-D-manno-octulosonate transaminase
MKGKARMSDTKLALEGGQPTRRKPFDYQCIGGNLIGEEELALVSEVITAKTLFRHYGPQKPHMVDDFEQCAGELVGTRYALATATGSGAWFCALAALDLHPGDEVIIPSFGWITVYSSVRLAGAEPVFADIDDSLNLSPEGFQDKITPRTRAVMVIHYQGGASRLDEIVAIARRHDIRVIEDVAQACGGVYRGRRLGTWGDIGCFSLQTHKMITSGDGGFLTTNDQLYYERAVRFHDLGLLRATFERRLQKPVMTEPICGMQWRMNELSGAIALAQMRKLPDILKRVKGCSDFVRRELAAALPDLKFRAVLPENDIGILVAFDLGSPANVGYFKEALEAEGCVYGPTSYCQTMGNIEVVRACLMRAGRYEPAEFEATERIEKRFASIAILPVYTDTDVEDIARGAAKVLRAMKRKRML